MAPGRLLQHAHHGWLRRIVGIAALAALVAVVLVYRYVTDPERVRLAAQGYLETLVGGEVTVQRARFSLFEGIELGGVWIVEPIRQDDKRAPSDERWPGPAAAESEPPARAVLSCADLRLRQHPLAALVGKLIVEEIVALRPTLTIYRDSRTGRYNVNSLLRVTGPPPGSPPADLPTVRLRNARLRLGRRDGEAHSIVEDLTLSIVATPLADGHTYELAWEGGGAKRSKGRTLLDLEARTITDVEGGLPWLTLEGAFLAVAARFEGADDWCELLGLTGQLKVRDFHVSAADGDAGPPRATVELRDATVSLPLDEEERSAPCDQRYLRFTEVSGRLDLGRDDARARFTGLLHGGVCHLDVRFTRGEGGGLSLAEVGFEGRVRVERLHLPAGDDPHRPDQARFVNRWRKLRHFYRDYNPHGTVNLEMVVKKPVGPDRPVKLSYARLEVLDCDASYRLFPYRLQGIAGTVEYRPGGLELTRLSGEHAGGRVTVSGTLAHPNWYTAGQLEITGRNLPVDRALHDALGERYRRIWDRFELAGTADIDVAMERTQGSPKRTEPWRTVVQARFIDLNAQFEGFRYPIEHLAGRLRIDPQELTVTDLAGRCGDGSVVFNGAARLTADGAAQVDLRLSAEGLAFDDRLYEALPEQVRSVVQQFDPRGTFDLTGRLATDPAGGRLIHDLKASLGDVRLTYQGLPLPIESISGDILLTPQRITVEHLEGRWRETRVVADGLFDASGEVPRTRLRIACSRLELDEHLGDLLPEELGGLLSKVQVTGPVDTATQFVQVGAGDQRRVEQTTRVSARGVSLTYAPFPLPLTDVRGSVTIGEGRVEIENLTGRCGEGTVTVTGEVRREPEQVTGSLRVRAHRMPLDEQLRAAMPWRLRRTWNNLQPTGSFDLELSRLEFRVPAGQGASRWDFDAGMTLHQVGLDFGVKLARVSGTISGSGRVDDTGLSLAGRLEMDCAEVNGRRVTGLTGRLARLAGEQTLVLGDLRGRFYDGSITATVEVNQASRPARYSCSATIAGARLDELVNGNRPPGTPLIEVTGRTDAHLYLNGRVGDPGSTEGGGRVYIEQARMFRLPILLSILNVLGLAVPAADSGASQTASAEFFIFGGDVELRDILLRDNTMAMIGTGRLRRNPSELDLRLVAVSPHRWFRLPVLTELLEGTARELVEIRVQGPLSAPEAFAHPLRGVSGAVETLLGKPAERAGSNRQ